VKRHEAGRNTYRGRKGEGGLERPKEGLIERQREGRKELLMVGRAAASSAAAANRAVTLKSYLIPKMDFWPRSLG
jgi:hypothetical protein